MKTEKQLLHEEYETLAKLFGMYSRLWDELYTSFSWYIFCKANRRYIIAQYIIWETFTEKAKVNGFVYYQGIDKFLKEYKVPVERCLKIGQGEFSCGD